MIVLSWPSPDLSPNARVHWRDRHKATSKARSDAYFITKAAHIRVDPGLIPLKVTFYPPDARRRDDDNMIAAFKASRDGIAEALGVDDSIFRPQYEFGEPMKHGRVLVEVIG